MPFTKPVVIDNQQAIALDFNDLADLPEELLRRFIQNMVVQGETDLYGWVLYGLTVTDSSEGAVTSVQITAGACILPPSAGDEGYRLLIVPANINVPLTLPEAGTRTDVIQIVLQQTATENAARYVRSLGPGGEPQAEQQNINTRIRVTGAEGVNEGGGAVASPGAVRLAAVAMSTDAITGVTDYRAYLLPNGGPLGAYVATKFDSLREFATVVSSVLSQTEARVNVNIEANGKLKTTLAMSAGDDLVVDAGTFNVGERDVVVDGGVTATGEGDFTGVRVGHEDAVDDFRASTDFLKINGASVARLIGKAWMTLTWDGVDSFDFTAMLTGGHGVSITRQGVGNYTVTIDPAVAVDGVSAFDATGVQTRYSITAEVDPYTNFVGGVDNDADDAHWQIVNCHPYRLRADASNIFRVVMRLADGDPDPAGATPVDRSFTVRVFGPFRDPA